MFGFVIFFLIACVALYLIDEAYQTIKGLLTGSTTSTQIINFVSVIIGIIISYIFIV